MVLAYGAGSVDEVSTESGSDRVSIDATIEMVRTMTRSLPLPVLTPHRSQVKTGSRIVLDNSLKTTSTLLLLFTVVIGCLAQTPPSDRQQFIRVEAPVVALTHVRVIDGTGAAPLEDQTIVITGGKIQS